VALSDKDLQLKLEVATIFRRMGYVTFTEVDLSAYCYQEKYTRKNVTDFDILGIFIEPDLGVWTSITECKSATGQAMQSLLKLNGVKEFYGAQKAYFVQQNMDVNAREVGHSVGVWCLDASNLKSLMNSLEIDEKRDVLLETKVYNAKQKLLEEQKKDYPAQTKYLRYDYWTLPDNRNILNMIQLFAQMVDDLKDTNEAHVLLSHQLVTAFALSTIKLTGNFIRQNIDNSPDGFLTALLGGSRERRDREAIYDTLAKIVPEAGLSMKPEFFDEIAELMNRYKNSVINSHRIVFCLDDMTRRILVPEYQEIEGTLIDKYGERTIKLARDAMHFVMKVTGVSENVFSQSLNDGNIQESNSPK